MVQPFGIIPADAISASSLTNSSEQQNKPFQKNKHTFEQRHSKKSCSLHMESTDKPLAIQLEGLQSDRKRLEGNKQKREVTDL
jgi:hypothetical protein